MSRVLLRPTTAADLPFVIGEKLPFRIQALTAYREPDGAILGIGGLAFPPNGPVIVFAQINDEGRRYPIALHKTGLAVMGMLRASNVTRAVATADQDNPARLKWLRRLGFVVAPEHCQDVPGQIVFMWDRMND